jgi:hypothetical protein
MGIGSATPNLFAYAASVGSEADRARNMGLGRGMYMAAPLLVQVVLEPVSKEVGAGGPSSRSRASRSRRPLSWRWSRSSPGNWRRRRNERPRELTFP